MPIITPGKRRVGLSTKDRLAHLLSQVGGRAIDVKNQVPSKMGGGGKTLEPKSIDAPPESSSEEEDYRQLRDSDDDDNDSRRGDIKPTTFNRLQEPSSLASNTRKSAQGKSRQSSQQKRVIRNSQSDEPSSSAGSKRSAEHIAPESTSHLTNEFGFTSSQTSKKTKSSTRRPTTYGSASSQPRSSQVKLSQKSGPRSSATRANRSPPPKFKACEIISSPDNGRSLPGKGFVKPESSSPEKVKPSNAFKQPSLDSSPRQDRPTFRHVTLLSDESPAKSKSKLSDSDDESDAKLEKKSNQRAKRKLSRKSKVKIPRGTPETKAEETIQRPVFKLHALDESDDLNDGDDKLTAIFEDSDWDEEVGDTTIDDLVATTAKCPMCHEAVDADLLAKYSDRGRMNIKKQTAFCRLHKRQTALNSRSQKGYPKIDWGTLNSRLKIHKDFLKDILEGTQQSHYRDILRENVESGKNRTLLKTEDSLTPGYYGPRGLRAMTEYIMRTLSSVVRKRAIEDRLVSARGYTGYVQAVLVPELTVRLIMEDMGATEEDARKIMQDSIEVGELLYEDIGDVVAGVSDEEEP